MILFLLTESYRTIRDTDAWLFLVDAWNICGREGMPV